MNTSTQSLTTSRLRTVRVTAVALLLVLVASVGVALVSASSASAALPITGTTPVVSDKTPVVGQELTAYPGVWRPSGVKLSYQWYRGSTAIPSATASTYTVTAADLGAKLKVRVKGSKSRYPTTTKYSSLTATVDKGTFTSKPTPLISDITPAVEQTLTATPGTWLPTPDAVAFQWYRVSSSGTSSKISGATSTTYKVGAADKDYRLKVMVVATRAGFTSATRTSATTAAVRQYTFTASPTPTLSGLAVLGQTLKADTGTWAPTPTSLSYQWKRAGVAIADATGSSYQVAKEDVGSAISVTVTAKRSGYLTVSRTSVAVTPTAEIQSDLRAGTYNLHGANNDAKESGNMLWAKRMPVAAAQIRAEGMDVLGLQEASPVVDQAGQLVKALGTKGGAFAQVKTSAFSNGTKIIYNTTKLKLVDAGVVKYAKQETTSKYKQRFMAWATFRQLSSGKTFFFANTHLDPYSTKNATNTIKVAQWKELITKVRSLNAKSYPVVVVGDFNTTKYWSESAVTLPAMKEAGFGDVLNQAYNVNPPVGVRAESVVNGWINSFNGFRADITQYAYSSRKDKIGNSVDWIFATNSLRVKQWKIVIDYAPETLRIKGIIPSDHNMIAATIVL